MINASNTCVASRKSLPSHKARMQALILFYSSSFEVLPLSVLSSCLCYRLILHGWDSVAMVVLEYRSEHRPQELGAVEQKGIAGVKNPLPDSPGKDAGVDGYEPSIVSSSGIGAGPHMARSA
jgi:hypothetical protein